MPLRALLVPALVLLGACAAPAPQTPAAATDAPIYELFVRSATPEGTLRAAQDRLDSLQALGIEVVWLMPIHPVGEARRKGRLGSPYAVRDYRAVDPALGSLGDLRAFVDAAHARGMRVILDWVANHTAWDHPWVAQHPEWYTAGPDGERPIAPPGTDWTDVADLDYDAPGLAEAMTAEMLFWVREAGVDGFRFDVAGMVPGAFWTRALPAAEAAGATFFLAEWGEPAELDGPFDLFYGWGTYGALKQVWQTGEALPFLDAVLAEEAEGGARRFMHFVTNHDETSWDAAAVDLWQGPDGMRAAMSAMYGLPGAPLVYNGQEAAAPQRLNLFEDEAVSYAGPDLRPWIRRWFRLRAAHPSLVRGAVESAMQPASPEVIAYRTVWQDEASLVLVNPTGVEQLWTVPPELGAVVGRPDALGGPAAAGTVLLEAYGSRLFVVRG